LDAGIYILTAFDARGCSTSIEIPLLCLYRPIVTQFISPNSDGFNDAKKIYHIERFPNNKVTIFNSFGEQIRVIRNYNNETNAWDGTNEKGQLLPDGTYFYILEAEGISPTTGWILMKGTKSR
jgi:gliding motility-associated-like protein